MVEFSEGKFFLCRELFLTKSSVNRAERSVPFCDRGVFRMFISITASCTCNKVYVIVTIASCKSLPEDVRKSQQSSCLTKMLTRRHKKKSAKQVSDENADFITIKYKILQILTGRCVKSQQNNPAAKVLT